MQIRRIELEGRAGHVAIERRRGSTTIRIDSIIANPPSNPPSIPPSNPASPRKGEQAWKTWKIDAKSTDETQLFWIATEVQRRCDGVVGTHGDVDGYFRELQRFQD